MQEQESDAEEGVHGAHHAAAWMKSRDRKKIKKGGYTNKSHLVLFNVNKDRSIRNKPMVEAADTLLSPAALVKLCISAQYVCTNDGRVIILSNL